MEDVSFVKYFLHNMEIEKRETQSEGPRDSLSFPARAFRHPDQMP